MKRTIGIICFVLFMCFITIGCGKKAPELVNESMGYSDAWKQTGFKYLSKMEFMGNKIMEYHETDCKILSEVNPGFAFEQHYTAETYLQQYRYTFHSYLTDAGWNYYLEKISPTDENLLYTEILSGEKINGRMLFADGVKESDIAVLFGTEERGEISATYVMHFDEQGKLLSREEVSQDYKVKLDNFRNVWWCDEQGYGYLLSNEGKTLTVRKQDGEEIYSSECTGQDSFIATAFHTPNGDIIFVENDQTNGKTNLFWINLQKKMARELVTINMANLYPFSMLNDGNIMISQGGFLFRWNTETGERRPMFRYMDSAIPDANGAFEYTEHVSMGEDGKIYLYVRRREEKQIYTLSNEEQMEEENSIVLVDMTYGESYVNSCTTKFNYLGQEQRISYKKPTGTLEDNWNHVMAEFALGKGPDMILVYPDDEQWKALYQKGLLANLSDYIPDAVRENIFPGILDTGTINGEWVGMGFHGIITAFLSSKQLWSGDMWTTEDVIKLVEENKEVVGIYSYYDGQQTAGMNLQFMVCRHLENSPFIDWKKRMCDFENPLFINALKLSKERVNQSNRSDELLTMIREGKYLGCLRQADFLPDYRELLKKCGEDCHLMGFAGQEDYSGYWTSTPLILVNKNTKYPEIISDYLQYLLKEENQFSLYGYFPARRDVVRHQIDYENWDNSMTEEQIEAMMKDLDSLGPYPYIGNVVEDIILEEADSFFNGNKSAEDVAKIINNRVQLYLNE